MTPILGIMASQISGHLVTNSYESIATVNVTNGTTSTVTFSSIPSTYKHLQIRGIARDDRAATANMMKTWANNDTGANYTDHWLFGDGSTASAAAQATGPSYMQLARIPSASATASVFGPIVMDILDYANTNKYKTFRSFSGYDGNGAGLVYFTSGLWLSTSAINRIDFQVGAAGGTYIAQYSSFALYGVKG